MQMRTLCHRCAFYSSIPIVNLPLINHTVSNLFFFNDFCISYVFSILNFGPISRDTEVEFIVYLFLEFIRAEQGTYFSWKYYVFPEIFYSV